MREALAYLTPTFDDDYALYLCGLSIAPYVDEFWVYDDASTDQTVEVIDWLGDHFDNIYPILNDKQLGWTGHRTILLEQCDCRHIIMGDSDLVLNDKLSEELRRISESDAAWVNIGLAELTGDFKHTTGRGLKRPHYDLHPFYIDRKQVRVDYIFNGRFEKIKVEGAPKRKWGGIIFYHLKTHKSDRRTAARHYLSEWVKLGRPTDSIYTYMDNKNIDVHAVANKCIFETASNPVRPLPSIFYIPKVCQENNRFEVIYNKGKLDRIDHGWSLKS